MLSESAAKGPKTRAFYPGGVLKILLNEGLKDCLVRSRRLELPRAFAHNDLNVARLPVPPRPHNRQGPGWPPRGRCAPLAKPQDPRKPGSITFGDPLHGAGNNLAETFVERVNGAVTLAHDLARCPRPCRCRRLRGARSGRAARRRARRRASPGPDRARGDRAPGVGAAAR